MTPLLTRLLDPVDRVLRVAITALIALLIVPVVLQILARYVDFIPRYIWTEEVARFCFIWIIMIGAMIAVRDDTHFDVDLLPTPRPPAGQGWARLVVHLAIAIFAAAFLWSGKIGRAWCRARVSQYCKIAVAPVTVKK